MHDLLPDIDHAALARVVMLKAVKARAATKDDLAAIDIAEALEGFEVFCAQGNYFEVIRRGFWLAARASREAEEGVMP
jgi:hypothetical protein